MLSYHSRGEYARTNSFRKFPCWYILYYQSQHMLLQLGLGRFFDIHHHTINTYNGLETSSLHLSVSVYKHSIGIESQIEFGLLPITC